MRLFWISYGHSCATTTVWCHPLPDKVRYCVFCICTDKHLYDNVKIKLCRTKGHGCWLPQTCPYIKQQWITVQECGLCLRHVSEETWQDALRLKHLLGVKLGGSPTQGASFSLGCRLHHAVSVFLQAFPMGFSDCGCGTEHILQGRKGGSWMEWHQTYAHKNAKNESGKRFRRVKNSNGNRQKEVMDAEIYIYIYQ